MWILQLNDMRSPKIEILTTVCRAETREELEALIARERVEFYRDGPWGKQFRRGGILEWFNPPYHFDRPFVDIGTREEWAAQAARNYDRDVGLLPTAS